MALQVQERTTIRKVDYNLALVIIALNLIGLINLYSATHGPNSRSVSTLMWSQLIYLAAGWVIYAGVTFVDYRIFLRLAYPLYGINVCLLFLVLILHRVMPLYLSLRNLTALSDLGVKRSNVQRNARPHSGAQRGALHVLAFGC